MPEEQEEINNEEAGETTERGPEQQIIIVTDKGYITRTTLSEFRVAHRGTRGTRAMFLAEDKEKGNTISVARAKEGGLIFVLTKNGQGALVKVDEIKAMGRGKSGIKLVTLEEGDVVVSVITV